MKSSERNVGESIEMFLASKIFEVKRKGARDVILTSNILFDNIWRTRVCQIFWSVMSFEADTSSKSTDSRGNK